MSAEKKRKKFVIYTRCSTDDQAKGDFTTLDAQAHHCRNMLEAFGYELADFGDKGIINDDGYSGKDLNRPGIQAILKDIQSKKSFDGIIFFRLDRLTRNPRDLYGMIDTFKAEDIAFLSVRENLDSSTAIGRVVIGIIGLLSAFERELTGERVRASAIARARQGKWVGGKPPFGYRLVKTGEQLSNGRRPSRIVIDTDIAPYIQLIFKMAADNKSLSEIGNELMKRNVTTFKKKVWCKQTLSKIIKNPFYKGMISYAGEISKGLHEGLVNEDLWRKANRILSANIPGHRFLKTTHDYHHLLKGILLCGSCGSYYISTHAKGKMGNKFYYYECSKTRQKLGCNAKRISATSFDRAVIDFLGRASKDRNIIVKAIGNAIEHSSTQLDKYDKEIRQLKKKLDKAKDSADKLLNLAIEKVIPKGRTYSEKMDALETEITVLEDKLGKAKARRKAAEMTANSNEYLHANLQLAMRYLDQATPDAQIALLKALIKVLKVYDDHVKMEMFINEPNGEIVRNLPLKDPQKQRTPLLLEEQGSTERQQWRGRGDSNPRSPDRQSGALSH